MADNYYENAVGNVLSDKGFKVQILPKLQITWPDLLATSEQRFLIEVKSKEDDSNVIAECAARLASGEIVHSSTPFTPRNTISGIIEDGVGQLASYPVEDRDFCLLWLIAIGSDARGQYEQFRSTLYGIANVIGPDAVPLIPCYFLRDSAFFRWREILDGAVISTIDKGELCINSYSTRATALRISTLGAMFSEAIVDPLELEQGGHAYVADCCLNRSNEAAILQFIQEKYNRPALMTFNVGSSITSSITSLDIP